MPASTTAPRRRRLPTKPRPTAAVVSRALMVIDHERLQGAAWGEFHTARKRLDKVARELHRHEEVDVPAYTAWLHRTFPILVTTLRELHEEVTDMSRKIHAVRARSAAFGGSLKQIWRRQKEREANPEPPAEEHAARNAEDDPDGARRQEARPGDFARAARPAPAQAARDIYRRLVQWLHPDRGGKWTAIRERLWHEVQQAWAAADVDWLSRLEVEWDTAHEELSPTSPLSRLRRAIDELLAARRDIERKLREYRASPPWRFTRTVEKRAVLARRVEIDFARDIAFLRRQHAHLAATIAGWEEDWTRPNAGLKSRRYRDPRR